MGIFESVLIIASVAANILLSVWGKLQKRKRETMAQKLSVVAEGLNLVVESIENNKETIEQVLPSGRKITSTIKDFGAKAVSIVDAARKIAAEF